MKEDYRMSNKARGTGYNDMTINIPINMHLWNSYEYFDQSDRFHSACYHTHGGPQNGPFIKVDDSMWSVDTPENPHSILALMYYCSWNNQPPTDLRDATVEFCLRGDHLDLKGAQCFFWIHCYSPHSTRWHYTTAHLDISHDSWGDLQAITLPNDPAQWQRSYSSNTDSPASLNLTLRACSSFGFSFIGFSDKVTGRLSLASFSIYAKQGQSAYSADFATDAGNWLTVSRVQGRQVPARILQGDVSIERGNNSLQKNMILNKDDFVAIQHAIPFSYLLFARSKDTTRGADLRNTLLFSAHFTFDLDLKGGAIHFFVENTATNTRWLFREPVDVDRAQFKQVLSDNESCWFRLSGNAGLGAILAGEKGEMGYDYFGFMAVNVTANPSGVCGIHCFSLGPSITD